MEGRCEGWRRCWAGEQLYGWTDLFQIFERDKLWKDDVKNIKQLMQQNICWKQSIRSFYYVYTFYPQNVHAYLPSINRPAYTPRPIIWNPNPVQNNNWVGKVNLSTEPSDRVEKKTQINITRIFHSLSVETRAFNQIRNTSPQVYMVPVSCTNGWHNLHSSYHRQIFI